MKGQLEHMSCDDVSSNSCYLSIALVSGVRMGGEMRCMIADNTVFNQLALELIDSDSCGAHQGSPVQTWPSPVGPRAAAVSRHKPL